MQVRVRPMDDADDVQIPLIRQLMVQATDDMQFGRSALLRLGGAFENLLVGHDVALRAFQVRSEGAERAAVDAHVDWVEVRIDVVVSEAAVLALADEIGQLAESEQLGALVEEYTVVEG